MSFNISSCAHLLHTGQQDPTCHLQTHRHRLTPLVRWSPLTQPSQRDAAEVPHADWSCSGPSLTFLLRHKMALEPRALKFPKPKCVLNALRHRTIRRRLSPPVCVCVHVHVHACKESHWHCSSSCVRTQVDCVCGTEPSMVVTALCLDIKRPLVIGNQPPSLPFHASCPRLLTLPGDVMGPQTK